jgi:circadian clock protein KaiC
MIKRIKTNIPGFDKHIDGGMVERSLNLVSGGPGAGKTIFAMQFLHEGIMKDGEGGLYVSFEEGFESLMGDALVFGWDFEKLQNEKKCVFLTCKPMEEPNLQIKIEKLIKEYNVKRVVIDSISVFSMMFKEDQYRIRREFYKLADFLKSLNCTVLLTAEVSGEAPLDVTSSGGGLSRDGIIEFIADSIITLHNSGLGGEADRAIRVLKMRRTSHTKGPIPMTIAKSGMKVVEDS